MRLLLEHGSTARHLAARWVLKDTPRDRRWDAPALFEDDKSEMG